MPALSYNDVVRALRKLGFRDVGGTKHSKFKHVEGHVVTIPRHGSKIIPPGTLQAIAKQAGVTIEELARCAKSRP